VGKGSVGGERKKLLVWGKDQSRLRDQLHLERDRGSWKTRPQLLLEMKVEPGRVGAVSADTEKLPFRGKQGERDEGVTNSGQKQESTTKKGESTRRKRYSRWAGKKAGGDHGAPRARKKVFKSRRRKNVVEKRETRTFADRFHGMGVGSGELEGPSAWAIGRR